MKKEIILKVNENEIYSQKRDLEETRAKAQDYLNWHNEIEFCRELKDIADIKEFLSNPHSFYETEVRNHLSELTGLKTLPINIDNLVSMYEIPECQAWSLSEKFGFEFLQIDGEGNLFYDASISEKIEKDNTTYATPEQMKVLAKLDSLWKDIQLIGSTYYEGILYSRYEKGMSIMLHDIINSKSDNGIMWKVEALEKLVNAGFAKK